jgi:hypothetical protein
MFTGTHGSSYVSLHAYGMLAVDTLTVAGKEERYAKLRNPWAKSDWNCGKSQNGSAC